MSAERLKYTDFDADAVISGTKSLTPRERAFLIEDTHLASRKGCI